MSKLEEGQIAPDFEALSLLRGRVSLKDLIKSKKYLILYFYPKDDTMGCTKEACSFRDNFEALKSLNADVVGVSLDDIESHRKFASKYNLPFDLIYDEGGRISEKYGVLKSIFGKKFASRVTFIINNEGKIIKIFRKVNTSEHGKEIYEFLKNLELNK
jgi:Peroxiredoxin